MNPLTLVPSATNPASRPDAAPRRSGDDSHRPDAEGRAIRSPDTVDFSAQARSIAGRQAESVPDMRVELVQRVRDEIAAGTYETPDKYLVALSRALGEIETEF